jgi:hypothetical protein
MGQGAATSNQRSGQGKPIKKNHGLVDNRARAKDGGNFQSAHARQAVDGGDGLVERRGRLGARGAKWHVVGRARLVCRAAKCD